MILDILEKGGRGGPPRFDDAAKARERESQRPPHILFSIRDSQGRHGIQGLSFSLDPLRQPAAILFQQKASRADTFSEDAMRLLIARRPRNPLLPHLILRGGEP